MATVSQELQIKISASTSKLASALNRAKMGIKNFSNQAKMALKMVGMAFLGIGAGVLMLTKKLVNMGMSFETEMAQVSTLIDDITKKQLEKMSTKVLQLSSKFGMATRSMTKGLYDLVSAGVDAKESIEALEVATQSAIAGATTTAVSVDALTSVVNAYGKSLGENLTYVQRMKKASDYLFATIKYGKTTYAELGQSIGQVTSVAANADISLRELGAMIALLTKVGVKTPVAITAIKNVITTLMKPVRGAKDAAKAMGIDFSIAGLKAKGLHGFLMDVNEKLTKYNALVAVRRTKATSSDLKKNDFSLQKQNLAGLFRNVRGLQAVIVALGKAKNEYGSLYEKMGQVSGETEKAFSKMEEIASFKMKKIIQTLSNLGLVIGLQILSPLAKWIEMETEASDGWLKSAQKMKVGTKIIEGMATAFYGVQYALVSTFLYFDDLYFKAKTVASMIWFAFQSGISAIKIAFFELSLSVSKSMIDMFEPLEGKVPWVGALLEKLDDTNLRLKNSIRQSNHELTKDQQKYQKELMNTIKIQEMYKKAGEDKLTSLYKRTVTPLMEEKFKLRKDPVKEIVEETKKEKTLPKKEKTAFENEMEKYKRTGVFSKTKKQGTVEPSLSSWKKKVGFQEQPTTGTDLSAWKKKVGFQEQQGQQKQGTQIIINASAINPALVAEKVKKLLEKEQKRKIPVEQNGGSN